MLLNVEHLYKYFNGQALLKDINFTVEDREAVGLIGINGCGKSTLLNIITGSEGYDKTPEGLGSVNIAGKASIGFLRQNSGLNSEFTIGEEMKNAFAPLLETLDKMKVLEKKMADGGDIDSISHEYAELSSYFEARDGYRIDVKMSNFAPLNYKIPCSGVISRPAASTSCRSFFITSAGIHLRSTLTVRTRLRLRTMSIGA